jgi:DNA-binding transcriptional MerR regulator
MSRKRSLETICNSDFITVSELVELSNCRYSTIKYYTEIGLLPFHQVDHGLVRRYPRVSSLIRLDEIKRLKTDLNKTIEEIKKYYRE